MDLNILVTMILAAVVGYGLSILKQLNRIVENTNIIRALLEKSPSERADLASEGWVHETENLLRKR